MFDWPVFEKDCSHSAGTHLVQIVILLAIVSYLIVVAAPITQLQPQSAALTFSCLRKQENVPLEFKLSSVVVLEIKVVP